MSQGALGTPPAFAVSAAVDSSTERHYSVAEVAGMWGLSEKTIRRVFENEPGVLAIEREETRRKRGYKTLRIPNSILQRVHRRLRISA